MSDQIDKTGRFLPVAPPISDLLIKVPGPTGEDEWKNQLAEWADLLGKIPSMDRRQIYEALGKAKRATSWAYGGGCDCDAECDCPPPKLRVLHFWTLGVRPHRDIRVLRRRAREEHLRRLPGRPYRYAGVELRRPTGVIYMDSI